MVRNSKLLIQLSSGNIRNIRFDDFVKLLEGLGFKLVRISGSHHIFKHEHIAEIINIQNVKGQVKPYQVRQLLKLIERYNIALEK